MFETSLKIWFEIKDRLKSELDPEIYESYIEPISEINKEVNNLVYLVVDNAFIKTRVENNLLSRMNTYLSNYYGAPHYYCLLTKDEIVKNNHLEDGTKEKINFSKVNAVGLNPSYTFSSFIVGTSNRFAHRYAVLAAEQLSSVANPVYLFGSVGLGKTHLMQAIGNYILETGRECNVLYVRTQDFVTDYVNANRDKGYAEFSQKFDNCDVLLIDDIQFLENKNQCQIEFFKIFEKLTADKKLIVITSDRKPQDLKQVMTRLTSRFQLGMILDINKPDKDHRINILKSKLKQELKDPSVVSDEVIDYIATVCESNVRELEGALRRVLFYCEAFDYDYSLESAKEALKSIIDLSNTINNSVAPSEDIKKMLDIVSSYFNISEEDLLSNSRKANITYARKLCWYLLRKKYDLTFEKIGDIFGGKDHSTIMHGYEVFESEFETNDDTKKNVENVLRKMGKNPDDIL